MLRALDVDETRVLLSIAFVVLRQLSSDERRNRGFVMRSSVNLHRYAAAQLVIARYLCRIKYQF